MRRWVEMRMADWGVLRFSDWRTSWGHAKCRLLSCCWTACQRAGSVTHAGSLDITIYWQTIGFVSYLCRYEQLLKHTPGCCKFFDSCKPLWIRLAPVQPVDTNWHWVVGIFEVVSIPRILCCASRVGFWLAFAVWWGALRNKHGCVPVLHRALCSVTYMLHLFTVSRRHIVTNMWNSWSVLAVVGPSASCGEDQSYNIKKAEVKLSVKNKEKCPLQTMTAVLLLFSFGWLFNNVCSLSCSGPLFKSSELDSLIVLYVSSS